MGVFVSALGNPWRKAEFNLTTQAKFVERYGQRRADQFAEAAAREQAEVDALTVPPRTYILTRKIGGGDSGGGFGSSDVGPPG